MQKSNRPCVAVTANTSWYLYNFRKNTIISIINAGYDVVIIAPQDGYSTRLVEIGCKYLPLRIDQGGINPFKDMMTILSMMRIVLMNRFDVILNFTPKNNIYFSFAAKVFRVPVINNIAGLGNVFIKGGLLRKLCCLLYKLSQRGATKIFFQNEEDRRMFLTDIIPKYLRSERIPGSGVDLKRFTLARANDDGIVRFILVARMLYSKGIMQYIDCARIMKQRYGSRCEFMMLGFLDFNNPCAVDKDIMASWVEEGIVNYLGVSDNVENEISKADCVVLPSFYREGVPKSLLEAGALGKPIITTDNVGCRETVDHGINGFICLPQNTESLLQALEKMNNLSHIERLFMGEKSRMKMAKEFDEEIVIHKYLLAIEEALEPKMNKIFKPQKSQV